MLEKMVLEWDVVQPQKEIRFLIRYNGEQIVGVFTFCTAGCGNLGDL